MENLELSLHLLRCAHEAQVRNSTPSVALLADAKPAPDAMFGESKAAPVSQPH